MKVMHVHKPSGGYTPGLDCGDLEEFSKKSLLAQIVNTVETMTGDGEQYLVFSANDRRRISSMAEEVLGGLRVDQGLGHGMQGAQLLLTLLLAPMHLSVMEIPGVCIAGMEKSITATEHWDLAVHKPGI